MSDSLWPHELQHFPVHLQLLELAQIHVHQVGDAIQPSHPLVILFSSCLQSFPASGSFPIGQFLASGEGSGTLLQYSCLENPMDGGAWWAAVHGLLGVGHNWENSLSLLCIGKGNGNPLQCSCLENPRDKGAWWAAVYGVAQSRTRLKWLSSSSSIVITGHVYFTIQIRKFTFVSTVSGTLSAIEERPVISVEWVCRERPNLALKTVAV